MSKKLGIFVLIAGLLVVVFRTITKIRKNRAMGIIGGSDRPTAILLARKK